MPMRVTADGQIALSPSLSTRWIGAEEARAREAGHCVSGQPWDSSVFEVIQCWLTWLQGGQREADNSKLVDDSATSATGPPTNHEDPKPTNRQAIYGALNLIIGSVQGTA